MSSTVCRYYQQSGKCFYGTECKFLHSDPNTTNPSLTIIAPSPVATPALITPLPVPTPSPTSAASSTGAPVRSTSQLTAGAKEWTPSSSLTSTPTMQQTKLNPMKVFKEFKMPNASLSSSVSSTTKSDGGATVPASAASAASFTTWNNQASEFIPSGAGTAINTVDDENDDNGGYGHHDTQGYHADGGADVYSDEQQLMSHDAAAMYSQHHAISSSPTASSSISAISSHHHLQAPPATFMSADEFARSCTPVVFGHAPIPPSKYGSSSSSDNASRFMPSSLRTLLTRSNHLQTSRLQPDDPLYSELPVTLEHERYHSLMPFVSDGVIQGGKEMSARGVNTTSSSSPIVYKTMSSSDGKCYVIKRLLGCKVMNEEKVRQMVVGVWKKCNSGAGDGTTSSSTDTSSSSTPSSPHPSLLAPVHLFLTKDFTDQPQLCYVERYIPGLKVLLPNTSPISSTLTPAELSRHHTLLFSYLLPLVSLLSTVHSSGLILGEGLKMGRVCVNDEGNVFVRGVGVWECCYQQQGATNAASPISPPLGPELTRLQLVDLRRLALLLLGWLGYFTQAESIAQVLNNSSASLVSQQAISSMIEKVWLKDTQVQMSVANQEVVNVINHLLLIAPTSTPPTITSLQTLLLNRITSSYTQSLHRESYLTQQLQQETENQRLIKLLVKLNFVSGGTNDPTIQQQEEEESSGARYVLALLHDYIFHSYHALPSNHSGGSTAAIPNLDWGHVFHILNLLDSGSDEKLLLSSRTGESMLLVRYSELKRNVEMIYQSMWRRQQEGMMMGGGGAGQSEIGGGNEQTRIVNQMIGQMSTQQHQHSHHQPRSARPAHTSSLLRSMHSNNE